MVKDNRGKRKSREKIVLGVTEAGRIKRRLLGAVNGQLSPNGFTASEPWADICISAIESGVVLRRKKLRMLEADLYDHEVYPPGGATSSMVENNRTLRYMPPDITGLPLDEREDTFTMKESAMMPRSNSAVVIERIRMMRKRKPCDCGDPVMMRRNLCRRCWKRIKAISSKGGKR